MTTKTKTSSRTAAPRTAAPRLADLPAAGPWQTSPWTTEERLRRIEVMGQQVNGYVQFMCQVGTLNGSSAEAKENAVVAFYEQMVVLVRQLGRIQEDFRLE